MFSAPDSNLQILKFTYFLAPPFSYNSNCLDSKFALFNRWSRKSSPACLCGVHLNFVTASLPEAKCSGILGMTGILGNRDSSDNFANTRVENKLWFECDDFFFSFWSWVRICHSNIILFVIWNEIYKKYTGLLFKIAQWLYLMR